MGAALSTLRSAPFTAVVLILTGCGAASVRSRAPVDDVAALRRHVEANPTDARAWRTLALLESFDGRGEVARAERTLERARALLPDDPWLCYAHAVERETRGRLDEALSGWLDLLDSVARPTRSREPEARWLAEAALEAIEALEDRAPDWRAAVGDRIARRAAIWRLDAEARARLAALRIELGYRAGDLAAVASAAEQAGCITRWRVAGPFGPRELLGFDGPWPAVGPGPMVEVHDLGPTRGRWPVREVQARGCVAHVGGGPVAGGGLTVAEAFVEVDQPGPYVVRLHTPNSVALRVDGRTIAWRDARTAYGPTVTHHRVSLETGRLEIEVVLASRHPNPLLSVALLPVTNGEGALELPEARTAWHAHLRARLAASRGDVVEAVETLRTWIETHPASPVLLASLGETVRTDPRLSESLRRDEARDALERAARGDASAWSVRLRLARLALADGRDLEAIGALREMSRGGRPLVDVELALGDALLGRGWTASAEAAYERARLAGADACRPLRALMQLAGSRGDHAAAARLAEALVGCDARSDARYRRLVEARRWDEARVELARLAAFEPVQSEAGVLRARLDLERAAGATDDVLAPLLERLRERVPRDPATVLAQADAWAAAGRTEEAADLLERAMREAPGPMASLARAAVGLGRRHPMDGWRRDGYEAWRRFEASGRRYEEPAVLVLDYTVVRVFEDGSSLELTHNVWKLQSEEAIDEHAEWEPPEDAEIWTVRTIKSDGRWLEPDAIAGKSSISLPHVTVGDAIEYEYVVARPSPPAFAGGALPWRFYFQGYETPFDHSEYVVVVPASMPVEIDPRGRPPTLEERSEDGLRVLRWVARESRPPRAEPNSVHRRELLPSIAVGVGASWSQLVEGLRDALADRDPVDPRAVQLVRRIVGEVGPERPADVAARLFAWVVREIRHEPDTFGLAPAMVAARQGHRARVLHYLLRLAGIDAVLAIARLRSFDQTRGLVPDAETYDHLLVVLPEGVEPRFLFPGSRHAPVGYRPPVLRGTDALLLAPGAPTVVLPEAPQGSDAHVIEADLELLADGSARGRIVETLHGVKAVRWREMEEEIPEARRLRHVEEHHVGQLFPGARLRQLHVLQRELVELPVVLRYEVHVPSIARVEADRTLVLAGLLPTMLSTWHARADRRSTPQLVVEPVELTVRVRVALPPGMRAVELPPSVQLRDGGPTAGRFSMQLSAADGRVTLERNVELRPARIEPEHYPQFARFCRAVDEAEAREIRIGPSS
ncbi:MAG: DUF3857 domain-containing protein [Myxococcota bacterium]|nr:DUF3857 domain-containing protein [Myxococcota bacterium]MDW8363974.1 DUF3857 domain-containing protein [Myxococcales bacterium]